MCRANGAVAANEDDDTVVVVVDVVVDCAVTPFVMVRYRYHK